MYRVWSMGAVVAVLAAAAAVWPAPAAAQAAQGRDAAPAAAAAPPREGQYSAWMLETGRVADAEPARQAAGIPAAAEQRQRERETPVKVHASQAESSRAVKGHVNQALLEVEAQPYLKDLRACPIEVARARQVPLGAIESGDLQLSFTIQPSGNVTGAQVFAAGTPDEDLLTCIGKRMFLWHFTPPDGGPAKVELRVSLKGGRAVSPPGR